MRGNLAGAHTAQRQDAVVWPLHQAVASQQELTPRSLARGSRRGGMRRSPDPPVCRRAPSPRLRWQTDLADLFASPHVVGGSKDVDLSHAVRVGRTDGVGELLTRRFEAPVLGGRFGELLLVVGHGEKYGTFSWPIFYANPIGMPTLMAYIVGMAKIVSTDQGPLLTSPVNAGSLSRGDLIVERERGSERVVTIEDNMTINPNRHLLTLQDNTGWAPWVAFYSTNEPVDRVVGGRAGGQAF